MKNYLKNRQEKGSALAALVVSLKKPIIKAGILIIGLMLLGTTTSKAALQANPTTHKSPVSKTGAAWITQIRQMETTGQTMGLDETLNGLNATSEDNGIDVHMMLPTEYGAVAILSASGYGNPGKLRDEADAQKRTTTGNSTGVYFTGDRWEWIAFGIETQNQKYMNSLTNAIGSIITSGAIVGWHGGCVDVHWGGSGQTVWNSDRTRYVGRCRVILYTYKP